MKDKIMITRSEVLRANLRSYLDAVQMSDTQIVVQRNGKPVAVIVNYDAWQKLQQQVAGQEKNDESK
ncbi:type II toxin-antitoxin system Phd/YefM family antitoxin [Candidatus Dojkabacteria bacterium]|uniref:Antitoxin n=1 Tax=Candidatus Dojkabacteria bacterium TaxID=2099670 RepID=A0A5C7J7C1_9BACT|nr:MAG: type II toxin-antitoxin system Phd/YefM family antitoxin [Candidatus Dojkabacteria bacterium]